MLKGIDPLISPDLLRVLAQMGHGDEIAICDANFPATSVAAATVHGQALRIDCDARRALQAVLSLIPIDDFLPDPVITMQVVGDPEAVPVAVGISTPLLAEHGATPKGIERFAFYERARACFAVLSTREERPYGNFIIRKGVILP
ncbi:RbsD/FucU family protein [Paracoccus pacificus]|uniref:RbsD/FucU family protein n=1 Tax=Paracoccus pacificus TaxID=1463598 RepID=A0ABW4R684_9RHOB